MYDCRCPNDGKMPARLAWPPLSVLRYVHLCDCGRRVEGKVRMEALTKRITGQADCPCGRSGTRVLGYLVAVKCRGCKATIQF